MKEKECFFKIVIHLTKTAKIIRLTIKMQAPINAPRGAEYTGAW